MLNNLSWLTYGPRIEADRVMPIFIMSKVLSVSQYRHNKETALTLEAIRSQARNLLRSVQAPNVLVEIFEESIDILLEYDETLAYFVAFCAIQLDKSIFLTSLHRNSLSQDLIAGRLDRVVERIPGNTFLTKDGLIWLPFDISPAIKSLTFPEKPKEPTVLDPIGTPINDQGQLKMKYYKLLKSQLLRKARRIKQNPSLTLGTDSDDEVAIEGSVFSKEAFFHNLASMFEGICSDLFLQDKHGQFYLRENSEIQYYDVYLQINETTAFLNEFISLANNFLHEKNILLNMSLKNSRQAIFNAWHYQLGMMRTTLNSFASHKDGNLLRMFSALLDYLKDKFSLTVYTKKLIQTNFTDLELSKALFQLYKLTSVPHYKYMLIDLNRFIALSWMKYLTQPEMENENDYIRSFCGEREETESIKINELVTTSRLIRKMKGNLYISKDFDELYEETIKESSDFEDLDDITKGANPLDAISMSSAVVNEFTSPVRIKALISDYEDAVKLITAVFLPMSSHRMLQANEVTMSHLLSLGVKRRHILKLIVDNEKILYEAPAPLDLIITENHSKRLQSTRLQFLQLSSAYKALLQIDMKDNCFCIGEDRVAFFRRNKMLTIIRTLLNHVSSTIRYIHKELEEELTKVASIQDLINVQRRMMRYLVKRTRLETRHNVTSSIITNLADYSSRFAAAFSTGDARSCEIHYAEFYGYIRVLVESLYSETENDYAKLILVQLDRWDFLDTRRSESLSKRSLYSHSGSELNF